MEIVWCHSADRDLALIYGYLQSQSMRAARRFIRRIFDAVDLLTEMPRMGKISNLELERPYRELIVDHFKLFYAVEHDRIVIARVWDTRQDPAKFFIPEH